MSICVLDFCGSYRRKNGFRVYPFNCWADWDGSKTVFGGAYDDVPDMPSSTEPTEDEIENWIKKYWNEDEWYTKYLNVRDA